MHQRIQDDTMLMARPFCASVQEHVSKKDKPPHSPCCLATHRFQRPHPRPFTKLGPQNPLRNWHHSQPLTTTVYFYEKFLTGACSCRPFLSSCANTGSHKCLASTSPPSPSPSPSFPTQRQLHLLPAHNATPCRGRDQKSL
jgi:hypothetical protein